MNFNNNQSGTNSKKFSENLVIAFKRKFRPTHLNQKIRNAFLVLCIVIVIIGLCDQEDMEDNEIRNNLMVSEKSVKNNRRINPSLRHPLKPVVYIATVMCGHRLEEGRTMLKTAIFFGRDANLYLILITDRRNQQKLADEMERLVHLADILKIHIDYEIQLEYINPKDGNYWHSLFAPCSTQRLFFPLTLPHIDRLMYVDTDVLFLSSVTDFWNEFQNMTPSQLAAIAPEHELPGDGWYNREARSPYYGPRGLNTGVMLMNLAAMRSFDFLDKVMSINAEYRDSITWADQDMLNILFKFNPTKLHEVGCEFNYRVQHCACDYPESGDCGCESAEKNGISIFHGNRKKFHTEPFIANIYNAFRLMYVTESPKKILRALTDEYFNLDPSLACTDIYSAMFTKFEKYADRF